MDYEKKYKEALERAKIAYKDEDRHLKATLERIFPELQESEDERIRKEIMDFIDTKTIDSDERRNRWFSYLEKYKPIPFVSLEDTKVKMSLMQYISELNQDVVHLHPGVETCNEWIAWLEKQGEQKSVNWNELTWEDINDLETIMNEVHSDFRNGIGQKSFGLEVLERFLYNKDYEHLDFKSQNRWKPSDEQMKALHELNLTGNISYAGQGQVLIELYNDLKRLLKTTERK